MLDALALPTVTVDGRRISTWRFTAGLGLLSGLVILPVAALRVGLPPLELLATVPLLLGVDLAFTWVRRRLTGRETWVLYEHLGLVLVALLGVARVTGLTALATLDAFWPPLCALLAWGRCGCTAVGCCHGVTGSVGIRYPPEAGPWARGERRVPVQLVEAALWGLLGATGLLALAPATAGLVTAGGLAGYAIVRWALEGWRADRRGHLVGVPVGRWSSVLALTMSLVLSAAAGHPPGALVLAGVLTAAALAVTLPRWLGESPVVTVPPPVAAPDEPGELAAFSLELKRSRPSRAEVRHVGGYPMGAHWSEPARAWALSLAAPDLPGAAVHERLSRLAAQLDVTLPAPPVRTPSGLWFALASVPPELTAPSPPPVSAPSPTSLAGVAPAVPHPTLPPSLPPPPAVAAGPAYFRPMTEG